jgi:tyrosyl-tRNA synthetase
VYRFYQYWVRTDDADVETLLNLFTFLPRSAIKEICATHRQAPEARTAQKVLASEVTRAVHGKAELETAQRASSVLFGGEISGLSDRELMGIFQDVPATKLSRDILVSGLSLVQLLISAGICDAKAEARRLIEGGGVYINNRRVEDPSWRIGAQQLASQSVLVLRTGKKDYHLVSFT